MTYDGDGMIRKDTGLSTKSKLVGLGSLIFALLFLSVLLFLIQFVFRDVSLIFGVRFWTLEVPMLLLGIGFLIKAYQILYKKQEASNFMKNLIIAAIIITIIVIFLLSFWLRGTLN